MIKLIFISFVFLVNTNVSLQLPSTSSPSTALVPSNTVDATPSAQTQTGSLIQTIESMPAVELLRELAIKQNELINTILPIMVRVLTNPVPGLAEAIQRSFSLLGVTSYLVGPSIARSARNLGPVVEPLVGSTDGLANRFNRVSDLAKVLDKVMLVLGLDNEECKEAIACQAGLQVSTDFPILASYLSQASPSLRPEDKFTKILIDVMTSPNPQCISSCPNLSTIEKYWKAAGEKDLKTIVSDAFADSISKNVFSFIIDSADDAIQNGLSKLAR